MKIGLISHSVKSSNLGCSALAISNIRLMDEVFETYNVPVEYVVITPEYGEDIDIEAFSSLQGITKNSYTYKQYPRPKNILIRPWLLKKTDAFKECDYVIDLCGGDGYTDNYGIKRLFAESIPIFGCKWTGIKSFFAPQTIGPFNTKLGKLVAKAAMKKLKIIFVRDQQSLECCKKMGFDKKTNLVTDVAFALPYTKTTFNNGKFNIGINVSGLLYNGGYNRNNYFGLSFSYKDFIDMLLKKLTEDKSIQVHLVPHVIYPTSNIDDDYSICEELKKSYPNVILPQRFSSATEAKNYISGMDLFSGARMHATIGATSSGVPVIPVAYSRKVNGLYGSLEYPYYIDAKAELTLDQALRIFMDYKEHIDDLREGIMRAKDIYTQNLKLYQELFIRAIELNVCNEVDQNAN